MQGFPSVLFAVSPQCCDADSYVQYGEECASSIKACYGDLRPIGDYLWFSIPERLGLMSDSIIFIHIMGALVSVFFCAFVLRRFLAVYCAIKVTKLLYFLLLLVCLCTHMIFLRPTIFNTLSDPPSTVMLLLGIELLVLSGLHTGAGFAKALLILLSGIFLGLTAWIRAFYLYPVLACVSVYFILWLFQRKKEWKELLLLSAIIPIAIQFFVMYRVYGNFGYLQQDIQRQWTQAHLNIPSVGFDTIMPRNGYFWGAQYCESHVGILNGLELRDYKGVACVITERLRFYFGTYESVTYIYSDAKNRLPVQFSESENIGDRELGWFSQNLSYEKDVELAPFGQKTADRLTVVSPTDGGSGDTVQWIALPGNTPFTFSVWLWSPKPKTINLAIKFHADDRPVAKRQFTLTSTPVRYWVTGTTFQAGLYDVDIGRTPYQDDRITFGTEEGDYFYAWGAQLEKGNMVTDYDIRGVTNPDSIRSWKLWLLGLNLVAWMLVTGAIVMLRRFWLQTKPGVVILTLFSVVLAECVAIIPEQRFATGLMIVLWTVALTTLLMLFRRILAKVPDQSKTT